jgi:hypothetical protein
MNGSIRVRASAIGDYCISVIFKFLSEIEHLSNVEYYKYLKSDELPSQATHYSVR